MIVFLFFFKQKTAYEMRISDWSSDVCSSDLKALERRYASAAALVEDIERWQQGQPIRARPETFGYRAAKFVRRHPFGVATAATGLALLIAYAVKIGRAACRERVCQYV